MERIKSALTRKIGPLPAWGWLGILGLGYYYYRKRYGGSTSVTTSAVSGGTPTPQDPITLDPGQSVYNPNTGSLSTAPGGNGGGGDVPSPPAGSGQDTFGTPIGGGGPSEDTLPDTTPTGSTKIISRVLLPGKNKHTVAKNGKTTNPNGKNTVKGKVGKGRPRSGTAISHKSHTPLPWGLRGPSGAPSLPKSRATVNHRAVNTTTRSRPTTTATQTVIRQRPTASPTTTRQPHPPAPHNPPRPSAPAPRSNQPRTPAPRTGQGRRRT